MSGYGILRGQKIHTGGLKGIEIHNKRERPSRSNPDIDRKKTVENYSLLDEGEKSLNKRVNARCQELSGGKKIRSDAVKMYDFIATASPEEMAKLSNSQQRQYFQDTRDFLIRKFGRENIMYARVHMDESTPHMHVGIVPEYDGRLCAKKLFTPKSLRELQNDYWREVSSKYGLQRGEVGSKRKHLGTSKYKGVTGYNGKEKENLDQLEKVIKEKPVEEGIFQKEVIGYQISPAAADELIRLARVGGQAADERDRADRAEQEKEKALEREKSANAEAARLRVDNDFLRDELQAKEKDFLELKKSTEVFTEAPERIKKPVIDAAKAHAQERDALFAFLGRSDRAFGTKKALENPAVKGILAHIGVKQERREAFLKKCGRLMSGRGADSGDWSPLPAPAKMATMPLKIVKSLVEKAMSAAKSAINTAVSAGAAEEITSGFRYLAEHSDIMKAPWENLTEMAKDEIRARSRTAEDDY